MAKNQHKHAHTHTHKHMHAHIRMHVHTHSRTHMSQSRVQMDTSRTEWTSPAGLVVALQVQRDQEGKMVGNVAGC